MAEMKVLDMSGAQVGTIDLCDSVFAVEVNEAILHAAVRMYLLNQRQGTQSALTRTEVSGGGKKPWRQKGTGRARQGSTRAPHGGVVFAPKPRSYRTAMNKKARQLAIKSALSSKVAGGEFVCVDAITASEYKTKTMVNMLKAIGAEGKALVVLSEKNDMVVRSLANIPGVKTAYANTINVYDILNCDNLVMAKGAVEQITEVYA